MKFLGEAWRNWNKKFSNTKKKKKTHFAITLHVTVISG